MDTVIPGKQYGTLLPALLDSLQTTEDTSFKTVFEETDFEIDTVL